MTVIEASDGHRTCDWYECVDQAWAAREMSLRPPGFTYNVDVEVGLCRRHLYRIEERCPACALRGLGGVANCELCHGIGARPRVGAVVTLDWVKILEALGESGLLRSDA